jgi:hypothetical protein
VGPTRGWLPIRSPTGVRSRGGGAIAESTWGFGLEPIPESVARYSSPDIGERLPDASGELNPINRFFEGDSSPAYQANTAILNPQEWTPVGSFDSVQSAAAELCDALNLTRVVRQRPGVGTPTGSSV